MGLNFRKSIKVLPGVKLNLSKSGGSVSVGPKGLKLNVNSKGKARVTAGIPGTGVYYTKSLGKVGGSKAKSDEYKKRETVKSKKAALEQDKKNVEAQEAQRRENELAVEEYEAQIACIRNVHKEADEAVDWQAIYDAPQPYPGSSRASEMQANSDWASDREFAERILNGEIDAYLDAIESADPFEDLLDYGSDFEFGTDVSDTMCVEFHVRSEEVLPATSLSLTSTGKLSEKALAKSTYNDYLQDYVCSCSIRIARDTFALLPVKYVIVHAVDVVVNTATGNDEEQTILSVEFDRERFEDINFDRIDPSDFVSTFHHNMKFAKTTGFKPVEQITV